LLRLLLLLLLRLLLQLWLWRLLNSVEGAGKCAWWHGRWRPGLRSRLLKALPALGAKSRVVVVWYVADGAVDHCGSPSGLVAKPGRSASM
jgi:hypothetical protein